MDDCIFACLAPPGAGAREALLLARSIRAFAGSLANNPVWVLIPQPERKLTPRIEAGFNSLKVRLIPFALSEEARAFPFAAKTFAAARAEVLAEDETSFLIWLDRDSIVVQEPRALRLPRGKALGYRPVDHTLIGSPYHSPVDDFWDLIYRYCDVPAAKLFPMIASVDENKIRPYFNAGMLVVRPERKVLQAWAANFARLYRAPVFTQFYDVDILYRIFIHQAILTGTILSQVDHKELHELPYRINYPLHMHNSYPADRRPVRINDLITCRYDTFFQDPSWETVLTIDEPLKSWLMKQRQDN